jgi:hypothetical protein
MTPEREALEDRATTLAASSDAAELAELREKLGSKAFLDALDDPPSLLGPPEFLLLAGVMEELAQNDAIRLTHPLLVSLCDDPVFPAATARADLLIVALACVRPAPPAAIAFWDRHCQPLDGFANLTARALVANHSAPAMALFEQKLRDAGHAESTRASWVRRNVVPHRDEPEVLACCERLLGGGLSPALELVLIDALFDYQPDAWYGPDGGPEPPDPLVSTEPARDTLLRIAEKALSRADLSPRLREVVDPTIEMLRRWRPPAGQEQSVS